MTCNAFILMQLEYKPDLSEARNARFICVNAYNGVELDFLQCMTGGLVFHRADLNDDPSKRMRLLLLSTKHPGIYDGSIPQEINSVMSSNAFTHSRSNTANTLSARLPDQNVM